MVQYTRPSVDNLINNLPDVLKSSRQFVAWNVERGDKKVPLKADGRSWGNYKDPTCWRTFGDALDLIDNGRAFGVGLALPSPEQIRALPEFNLVSGLVAFDGDAKGCALAAPYKVPAHISEYVRSANSYSEYSPSLKGLRALIFGDLPTAKQCLNKPFGDGTELSLYRTGWVTLSGLPYAGSSPTIQHRQEVIDHLIEELWPDLTARPAAPANKPASTSSLTSFEEEFVVDWGRSANDNLIQQFIQGGNRTPQQLRDIIATWELRRGWDHGDTPDNSLYTKRIFEEALWLRRLFRWTLQDVVDIVITFCKKNHLRWSFGRAKKQIADGLRYISIQTCQRGGACLGDSALFDKTPTPLTCKDAQLTELQNRSTEPATSASLISGLAIEKASNYRDTFTSNSTMKPAGKVSHRFRHKSAARDQVLHAINQYRGWVNSSTVAAEAGLNLGAVKKQLQRLRLAGLVDGDGRGRYRKHRERRRKLKPCSSKPFPKCSAIDRERKMISFSALKRRGWPMALIQRVFPEPGKDYFETEISLKEQPGRVVKARFYWVSRIKAVEREPWFESERATLRMKHG